MKADKEYQYCRLFTLFMVRGKRHKMQQRKFCLTVSKNFFTLGMAEHWNRLLRDVVGSFSLETLSTVLDTILCNLLWVSLL